MLGCDIGALLLLEAGATEDLTSALVSLSLSLSLSISLSLERPLTGSLSLMLSLLLSLSLPLSLSLSLESWAALMSRPWRETRAVAGFLRSSVAALFVICCLRFPIGARGPAIVNNRLELCLLFAVKWRFARG